MRTFILLSLFLSFTLYAADPFEDSLKDIETKREEALGKWRKENSFDVKTLSPPEKVREYVSLYNKLHQQSYVQKVDLHKEACKTNKDRCLDLTTEASKLAVTVGTLNAKVAWINSNRSASAEEIASKFPEAKPQAEVVPEKIARDIASEEKPKEEEVSTGEVLQAAVAQGAVATDDPKFVGDIEAEEEKFNNETKKLVDEFSNKFPNVQEDMDDKAFTAYRFLQAELLGRYLQMLSRLCTKYPDNPAVCLSNDEIMELSDETESKICYAERFNKYSTATDKSKVSLPESHDKHLEEWSALAKPKKCQVLTDKDKTGVAVASSKPAPVVDLSDDEKSPRNYNSGTCKWVKDMPRKLVNGPGCTTAGRTQMCVGYVVCEQKQGGGKFVRMSTCGPDKCGHQDSDAVNCTKDLNYFSSRPMDETRHFVSPVLKKILSSEQ